MTKFFGFTVLIFVFIVASVNGQGLGGTDGITGGLGELNAANNKVNELVTRLTPKIIKMICDLNTENCPPSDVKIKVNNYKTQVVAGFNYFISATVGSDIYHIRIFTQSWTNTEEVHGVQGPKQHTDEVTYFV